MCPSTIDIPILNEFEEKKIKLNNSPPKNNQSNNKSSSPSKNAIDVVISMITPDTRIGISTLHLALSQTEPNWDVILLLVKTEPKLASIRGYSLQEQKGKVFKSLTHSLTIHSLINVLLRHIFLYTFLCIKIARLIVPRH